MFQLLRCAHPAARGLDQVAGVVAVSLPDRQIMNCFTISLTWPIWTSDLFVPAIAWFFLDTNLRIFRWLSSI